MKLGITYMVYDGFELLEFAVKSIRSQIDHISVTYQDISYFGNPPDPELFLTLEKLENLKLIDEIIFLKTDLSLHHKENELNLRNSGLQASRNAGCTHHISADVDEFYKADQLAYAKNVMDNNDYEFSVAYLDTYYKDPTFLVYPDQHLLTSFIHPIDNEYNKNILYPEFPFHMETTRRLTKNKKYKIFSKEELTIHHMSYVRKNIYKKFQNSDNARFYNLKKFIAVWENYQLGQRVCLIPDFMNRKTIQVENTFNIEF